MKKARPTGGSSQDRRRQRRAALRAAAPAATAGPDLDVPIALNACSTCGHDMDAHRTDDGDGNCTYMDEDGNVCSCTGYQGATLSAERAALALVRATFADEEPDGDEPPNLRESDGPQRCANCSYYDQGDNERGTCNAYGDYPVDDDDLCDTYKAQGGDTTASRTITVQIDSERVAAMVRDRFLENLDVIAQTVAEEFDIEHDLLSKSLHTAFDMTPLIPEPVEVLPEPHPSPEAPTVTAPNSDSIFEWSAVFCPEGALTDDGRAFAPGSINWRDLPLSLMGLTETSAAGGHDGAKLSGRIDQIWRDSAGNPTLIRASGIFDDGDWGAEIARLVAERKLTGVSVDLAIHEYEVGPKSQYFDDDGNWVDGALEHGDDEPVVDLVDRLLGGETDDLIYVITDAVIGMATVCPFQAFKEATIEVGNSLVAGSNPSVATVTMQAAFTVVAKPKALTAAACACEAETEDEATETLTASALGLAPLKPPRDWFATPEFEEVTPLTIDDDGRIYGHAWLWSYENGAPACHTAFPDQCVTAPHSKASYAYFHLGELECEDGDRISVGKVTLDAPHAGQRLSRLDATAHYDDTGTVAAHIVCGEDRFGGWVTGAVSPDLDEAKLRLLRGSVLSGDWRNVNGNLELIALLAVNVPGFPVPRVKALVAAGADGGEEVLSLVAAGVPVLPATFEVDEDTAAKIKALQSRVREGAWAAQMQSLLDRAKA